MHKKTLKQLQQISRGFPLSIEEYNDVQKYKGTVLLEQGLKEMDGEKIEIGKVYTIITPMVRDLDHYPRLKKYYKKHGPDRCVEEYLKWLDNHQKAMKMKYPDRFHKLSHFKAGQMYHRFMNVFRRRKIA